MSEHHGKANGQRCSISSGRLGANGRVEDSNHQEVGPHEFQKEGSSEIDAGADCIETNEEGRTVIAIIVRLRTNSVHGSVNVGVAIRSEAGGASPNDERTNHSSSELRKHVQETSDRRHLSKSHEGEGDSGVDVTARNVPNAIGEDSDTKAKGDSNRKLRVQVTRRNESIAVRSTFIVKAQRYHFVRAIAIRTHERVEFVAFTYKSTFPFEF